MIIGANRGIGRALLDGYLERGWECIATSRKEQVAEDNVSWIKLDVRDPNNHVPITGELDLLICNAGVFLDRGAKIGSGFEIRSKKNKQRHNRPKWDSCAIRVSQRSLTASFAWSCLQRICNKKANIIFSIFNN